MSKSRQKSIMLISESKVVNKFYYEKYVNRKQNHSKIMRARLFVDLSLAMLHFL